jgi:hypothetical protein
VVQVSHFNPNLPRGASGEAIRQEIAQGEQYDEEAREQNQGRLAQDDNPATAPGKVCELCGSVITAGQEARLRPDGWWIHESCPIQ